MAQRWTILLVEDVESDEFLALRTIKRSDLDCLVQVARDGEAACRLIAESKFDLILLDIGLPKMNGFEVLQAIRKSGIASGTPVVMLTSSDEPVDQERAIQFGANSYVQKAIDLDLYDSRLKIALYYWLGVHQSVGSVKRSAADVLQPLGALL